MERLLDAIVQIEREAKAIVADTEQQNARTQAAAAEASELIMADADKKADTQIAAFEKKQNEYLAEESARIDEKLEKTLRHLDEQFALHKDEWVDKLYALALGADPQ